MPFSPQKPNTFHKMFKEKVFNSSEKDEERTKVAKKQMKELPKQENTK